MTVSHTLLIYSKSNQHWGSNPGPKIHPFLYSKFPSPRLCASANFDRYLSSIPQLLG